MQTIVHYLVSVGEPIRARTRVRSRRCSAAQPWVFKCKPRSLSRDRKLSKRHKRGAEPLNSHRGRLLCTAEGPAADTWMMPMESFHLRLHKSSTGVAHGNQAVSRREHVVVSPAALEPLLFTMKEMSCFTVGGRR